MKQNWVEVVENGVKVWALVVLDDSQPGKTIWRRYVLRDTGHGSALVADSVKEVASNVQL
jgi:hypothetical protein